MGPSMLLMSDAVPRLFFSSFTMTKPDLNFLYWAIQQSENTISSTSFTVLQYYLKTYVPAHN